MMYIDKADKATGEIERLSGWVHWVGRHPGIILLGALAMAILSLQKSHKTEGADRDSSGEDVPLFI